MFALPEVTEIQLADIDGLLAGIAMRDGVHMVADDAGDGIDFMVVVDGQILSGPDADAFLSTLGPNDPMVPGLLAEEDDELYAAQAARPLSRGG